MMKFNFLPLEDVLEELRAHVNVNMAEILEAAKEFDIDWGVYEGAAQSGNMMVLTLRHENRLVGYSVFYLSFNLRNKRVIEATNHGVFLERQYRKKYGMRMLSEADRNLKRIGVNETSYINDADSFGRLLARNGYKTKSKIWSVNYGK